MMLSQTAMDALARDAMAMYGDLATTVTYYAKASASAVPTAHTVQAIFPQYRLSALSTDMILPTDVECRIPTALVTWEPGEHDEVVRDDGSRWRVITPGIRDGRGHPWYKIPLRRIG